MIAVLDWGIGGIGLVRELRRARPDVPLLYFSDSGFTPYGRVPRAVLRDRVRAVATFLQRHGATHLAVACNAASTVLPDLGVTGTCGDVTTAIGPLMTTGIVAHAIDVARRSHAKRLGIVGGGRTIRSGLYRHALASPAMHVQSRVAQPLSAHVEAGDLDSDRVRRDVARILQPLRHVDALLLACTHYPALMPLFTAHLPAARMLDPAAAMAAWVLKHFRSAVAVRKPSRAFTSGDPRATRRSARLAFGHTMETVERVQRL